MESTSSLAIFQRNVTTKLVKGNYLMEERGGG